ncbi:conserved protein of unknown function [Methanocaldococcus lauensis]|uniref:Uncharacterized protein n=1 Tax=Methanocaldococcus lauensis TaxID=2546128 RepID=A0A8D6PVS1_9EURY|nr:hypothetical protein [Methanocaldococcus lauensis]CAB3287155.1 conserved protein of unknown function [Methanocaldococcus lauensis]CAB3289570.1 conserved protein of unknown function [Methanocaldococcus lauensis]
MTKKKGDKLYLIVYFEGSNKLEGEFDFDSVTRLKDTIMKYLWTGKKDPIIIWNTDTKSFAIIDPSKVCCVEVYGSLMILDDIPDRNMK